MAAGYDGTWVAHPDLCKLAKDIFVKGLDGKNNQVHRFVIKTFFRQIFIDFKDVGLSVLRILFTPPRQTEVIILDRGSCGHLWKMLNV